MDSTNSSIIEHPSICFMIEDKVHVGFILDGKIESYCRKCYDLNQIGKEITFIGGYSFLHGLGIGPQSEKVQWCRMCWRSFAKSLFS